MIVDSISTPLHRPTVVIISGPPGTGKTTLARHIAHLLTVPLLQRDTLKEILFDTLGWSTRAWSQEVGVTSYHLLYHMMGLLLQTRQHFIIESNFNSALDTKRFVALQQHVPYHALQILCTTERTILFERLRRRSRSTERHPGHGDTEAMERLTEQDITGSAEPLALEGPIITLNTTDFMALDYTRLVQEIRQHITIFDKADI